MQAVGLDARKEGKEMRKLSMFSEVTKNQFSTLKQYVPVVAKVHGNTHPEFHEVRKLFDAIKQKTEEAGSNKPELHEEFTKLREITGNYRVPDDVCESYEAVYSLLAEMDAAYHV